MTMSKYVFFNVTPCSLVNRYQYFGTLNLGAEIYPRRQYLENELFFVRFQFLTAVIMKKKPSLSSGLCLPVV